MDKSYTIPYPQVDTKMDTDSPESRLNASREAIRLRMKSTDDHASKDPEQPDEDRPINSWTSLLMNMVTPSAKKVATEHPLMLLGGSAMVGAYLAWTRPWRGILGPVIVGAVVRNLMTTSFLSGSRNAGRILQHYLNRKPVKKYAPYRKQEHAQVYPGAEA